MPGHRRHHRQAGPAGGGRHACAELRRELDLDLVIANGENLAAGAGLTPSLAEELFANGVDVITSGNHIWDKREIYDYLDSGRPVLRPLNYPDDAPGRGWLLHTLPDGDRVAVVNVMGRVFMNQLDSPFAAMDEPPRRGRRAAAARSASSTSTARSPARRTPWAGTSTAA